MSGHNRLLMQSEATEGIRMDGVQLGNARTDGAARRGWYIGRFIDEDALRQTQDVEVKWGMHQQGEAKAHYTAEQVARTMSVLIRGRFRLTFRRGRTTEDVILAHEGDYAVWLPGVEHTWSAEADGETVVLTVRWPSGPRPQAEQQG